jgi:Ca2+-binding EF-hand superfamily protein
MPKGKYIHKKYGEGRITVAVHHNGEKRRYIRINGKQIKYYRYLMEKKLGRKLLSTEIVHHINGDQLDDRIENLEIISNNEHVRRHQLGKKSSEESINKIQETKKISRHNKIPYDALLTCISNKMTNAEICAYFQTNNITLKKILKEYNIEFDFMANMVETSARKHLSEESMQKRLLTRKLKRQAKIPYEELLDCVNKGYTIRKMCEVFDTDFRIIKKTLNDYNLLKCRETKNE